MLPESLGLRWPVGVGLMIGWNATGQDNLFSKFARDWDQNNVSRLAPPTVWHEAGSW